MKKSVMVCWFILMACGLLFGKVTTLDGNELLTKCEDAMRFVDTHNTDDLSSGSYCLGFVNGIMQMSLDESVRVGSKTHAESLACSPQEGITTGQAVRVVIKYLHDHPEQLHRDAHILVVEALRIAFPCK